MKKMDKKDRRKTKVDIQKTKNTKEMDYFHLEQQERQIKKNGSETQEE